MMYISIQKMHKYLEENIKRCIFNGMKSNGLQHLALKFKHPPPPQKKQLSYSDRFRRGYIYIYERGAEAVTYPGILFGGGGRSTNSVEDTGQREWGLGGQ
jgi:hypothetical protein